MTGEELKRRREALGLSQEKVADLAGIKGAHRRQAVYRWENGIRDIPIAEGALLDIRLGDLERRKRRGRREPVAGNVAG
jgi:transcriptional regulator with XRE-family HTH domain